MNEQSDRIKSQVEFFLNLPVLEQPELLEGLDYACDSLWSFMVWLDAGKDYAIFEEVVDAHAWLTQFLEALESHCHAEIPEIECE